MHQVIQVSPNNSSSWVLLAVLAGALAIIITILEIMLYALTKKRKNN